MNKSGHTPETASAEKSFLPKSRVEAFSDGVIAIIVTILVLEIKVPKLEGPGVNTQLQAALWHALPLVAAYVVSFMVLLVFWVARHHLLHSEVESFSSVSERRVKTRPI
jgi:uncharacterized membrane protein